jgi:hypothetical protein
MTQDLHLQRILTVDARKDFYDNYYYPPRLKQFFVDEAIDRLFAFIERASGLADTLSAFGSMHLG